jgi:hypothetical protein
LSLSTILVPRSTCIDDIGDIIRPAVIHPPGSILNLKRDHKERASRPEIADLPGSFHMLNGILEVIVVDVLAEANRLFI